MWVEQVTDGLSSDRCRLVCLLRPTVVWREDRGLRYQMPVRSPRISVMFEAVKPKSEASDSVTSLDDRAFMTPHLALRLGTSIPADFRPRLSEPCHRQHVYF